MSIPTLSCVPAQFSVGDTVLFTERFASYPVADWTAALWLSLNGGTPTSIAATTSGSNFLFTLTSAITTALVTGNYEYSIVVSSISPTGQKATPKAGTIYALPNYAVAQTPSAGALMLVALNEAIARLLQSGEFSSTNFNGQQFAYADLNKLRDWRVQLQAEVLREQQEINRRRGGHDPGRILTRFAPSGCGAPFNWPMGWPFGAGCCQ